MYNIHNMSKLKIPFYDFGTDIYEALLTNIQPVVHFSPQNALHNLEKKEEHDNKGYRK